MSLEEMMDSNGWRIDEINGERRLVTTDERGRAVIGPKPRRHVRRLFDRWRKDRMVTQDSNADTVVIDMSGVKTVTGLRARMRNGFYNIELHKAIQHTAVDVAMWAGGLALSATMLKLAWMVVSL